MVLKKGDIRLARSARMTDTPEGGGPPSALLLTSGRSNEIFPDISEETRTVGRVEIYSIHGVLRNSDTAPLYGANVIIAAPPADPNVGVTLLTLKDPFATRADIAKRIESGMAAGSEFAGYLLENHFTTMRSIQVLQRPGMTPPGIGKTFVLIINEGQSGERRQRVRIKSTDKVVRTFTEIIGSQLVDFQAQVTTCELFDGLQFDFAGSPPTRTFARGSNKTLIRETVWSDAGLFYSCSRVNKATQINDQWLSVDSVYTQVVPNSKTEVPSVDQRPTSRLTLRLAESPRQVDVGITPHTRRYKIAEENAGLTFVLNLLPLPEPGTIFIDYWALGQIYRVYDDGAGKLTGAGGGAVSYLTGSGSFTLKAVPDIGSSITITHGTRLEYTNRTGQANVRAPEFAGRIEADTDDEQVIPSSFTLKYTSGNVVRTVTDDGNGTLTGDGSGMLDYPSRYWTLYPKYMPDSGSQFQIDCDLDNVVVEIFPAPSVDAAGFVVLSLAQQPTAKSLQLTWATARAVSNSNGGQYDATTAVKDVTRTYVTCYRPEGAGQPASPGVVPPGLGVSWGSGSTAIHTD